MCVAFSAHNDRCDTASFCCSLLSSCSAGICSADDIQHDGERGAPFAPLPVPIDEDESFPTKPTVKPTGFGCGVSIGMGILFHFFPFPFISEVRRRTSKPIRKNPDKQTNNTERAPPSEALATRRLVQVHTHIRPPPLACFLATPPLELPRVAATPLFSWMTQHAVPLPPGAAAATAQPALRSPPPPRSKT